MDIVEKLGERLRLLRDARTRHAELVAHWLNDPFPLSPWETWTLLFLVRHRGRQQFVADTIRYRLHGSLESLAFKGAMGHPDCPQQGIVPGDPDWEYYFHGRGCCLTHRVSGEAIDVDFFDDTAAWFDSFFLVRHLESLTFPSFVESRLTKLHPTLETVLIAYEWLYQVGLLEQHQERSVLRLAFDHEALASILSDLEEQWEDAECRNLIAFACGDWLLLENEPLADSIRPIVSVRADSLRREHANRVVEVFHSSDQEREALWALRDLGTTILDGLLAEVLAAPISGTTSAALGILESADNGEWDVRIESLMNRIDPNAESPAPHCWQKCAEILLRHGRRSNIRERLVGIRSHVLGELAILAFEHFPDIAVELFRKALRSGIPCNRATAAAALAIIDMPWSRAELAAVLSESDDQLATAECRSALVETHSVECHQLVTEWEARNPHEPERGRLISMSEMSLRQCDGWIRSEMANLHDRVLPLKTKVPPPSSER